MRLRWLHLPIVAIVLFSSTVFAADELMKAAQAQFEPIPENPPALPGNLATPRNYSSARCSISIRGCPQATQSVAIPVTALASAVWMPRRLRLGITGSGAGATRRLY